MSSTDTVGRLVSTLNLWWPGKGDTVVGVGASTSVAELAAISLHPSFAKQAAADDPAVTNVVVAAAAETTTADLFRYCLQM